MAELGMVFIIVGWFLQFFSKGRNVKTNFVSVYVIGVALLVIANYQHGFISLSILNFVSLTSAIAVLMKIKRSN